MAPWKGAGLRGVDCTTALARLDRLRLRAAELAAPALARLVGRRLALGLVLALTLLFVVVGGLSRTVALLGLAGAVALTVLWRTGDSAANTAATASAQSGVDARRLWRMVIDAVPDPAVALDPAGRVVHANHLAEDLFGTRRVGGHMASMSRDPGLLAAVEEALAGRQPQTVELHGRVPVERRLLATMVPLDHAAGLLGDAPSLLITFRDLTEQDRLARMRADFVANASHELRTPLAYLKGSVETLQGSAKDDPAAREVFLRTMGEQAERMSRLVDDLLSLSRVEMREYLPPSGEVDLATVLADVAQTLEPMAQRAGITLCRLPARSRRRWCAATTTSSPRCSRTWCRTPSSTAAAAARWRCASGASRPRSPAAGAST